MPKLTTLNVSRNMLSTVDSIAVLPDCAELSSFNASHNLLDGSDVISVLQRVPKLCSLQLKGNPLVTSTRFYRKTVVSLLAKIGFLDDDPVFPQDRA